MCMPAERAAVLVYTVIPGVICALARASIPRPGHYFFSARLGFFLTSFLVVPGSGALLNSQGGRGLRLGVVIWRGFWRAGGLG